MSTSKVISVQISGYSVDVSYIVEIGQQVLEFEVLNENR